MGLLSNVWKVTSGIVTGNTNRVEKGATGIADTVGDLLNRATGATQANQWQWDMWKAQNVYNTPEEQMQRLKSAGLNPMLVYGNGSVAGNTASSMSAGSAAGAGALSALGAFLKSPWAVAKMNQDLQLGQSQIDQVKANNKLLAAQAAKTHADALSSLYNLEIAKKRGTRDSALSNAEALATSAEKVVGHIVSRRNAKKADDEKFNKKFFDWW